jgi:hypothetical protein
MLTPLSEVTSGPVAMWCETIDLECLEKMI